MTTSYRRLPGYSLGKEHAIDEVCGAGDCRRATRPAFTKDCDRALMPVGSQLGGPLAKVC